MFLPGTGAQPLGVCAVLWTRRQGISLMQSNTLAVHVGRVPQLSYYPGSSLGGLPVPFSFYTSVHYWVLRHVLSHLP